MRVNGLWLEGDLSSDLPPSWQVRIGRLAEVSVANTSHVIEVAINVDQIGSVKDVEHLEAELEIHPFRDLGVLIEVDIGFKEVRLAELPCLFRSF